MVVVPQIIGGLSNCLFGICTAIAHSLKHGIEYRIPLEIESPHYPEQTVFHSPYLKYLDRPINDLVGNVTVYYEPFFHYKEIPKFDCDYLILKGYWQSERYFYEYRTEILALLAIPYKMEKDYVACHIRRGDYLNLPNCHPVVTLDYIHSGIEHFRQMGYKKFLIFSDDFDYCWRNIIDPQDCRFEFVKSDTELEDLILAASCEHLVGSNSAFSWYIYWLNRNVDKVGVFPQKDKWFGSALSHNVENLYMPEWVLI